MKISEILGKEIVDKNGVVCGYVRGIYASGGVIRYLACADGEDREFEADLKDITRKDGALMPHKGRFNSKNCVCVRLGLPAFTEEGKFLGYVKEITAEKGVIKNYRIGSKNYPLSSLNVGDVVIVKAARVLKDDVIKDGAVIIKKGTALDNATLSDAAQAGEYVQTQLKSM